jgi:ferredoxin-NADP reductase
MPERPLLTATLTRSLPLSELTKHLEFQVETPRQIDFQAGQFISVKAFKEGKHITRAYSIASPPRGDNSFDLCLNRVQDGFMSNFLCSIPEGSVIHWHGPHGLFTLRQPLQESLFIAGGTGIAPFRGMIHWLFEEKERNQGQDFWLIYGARYESDIYYQKEFRQIEAENPNFHYRITLSRGSPAWPGLRGYVQSHVRELLQSRANFGAGDMHAYICGVHEMVDANRAMLKELGWDRKSILYERYD